MSAKFLGLGGGVSSKRYAEGVGIASHGLNELKRAIMQDAQWRDLREGQGMLRDMANFIRRGHPRLSAQSKGMAIEFAVAVLRVADGMSNLIAYAQQRERGNADPRSLAAKQAKLARGYLVKNLDTLVRMAKRMAVQVAKELA